MIVGLQGGKGLGGRTTNGEPKEVQERKKTVFCSSGGACASEGGLSRKRSSSLQIILGNGGKGSVSGGMKRGKSIGSRESPQNYRDCRRGKGKRASAIEVCLGKIRKILGRWEGAGGAERRKKGGGIVHTILKGPRGGGKTFVPVEGRMGGNPVINLVRDNPARKRKKGGQEL